MKSIEELARTYRLPETTTLENLETRFYTSSATFLTFGSKILAPRTPATTVRCIPSRPAIIPGKARSG